MQNSFVHVCENTLNIFVFGDLYKQWTQWVHDNKGDKLIVISSKRTAAQVVKERHTDLVLGTKRAHAKIITGTKSVTAFVTTGEECSQKAFLEQCDNRTCVMNLSEIDVTKQRCPYLKYCFNFKNSLDLC